MRKPLHICPLVSCSSSTRNGALRGEDDTFCTAELQCCPPKTCCLHLSSASLDRYLLAGNLFS